MITEPKNDVQGKINLYVSTNIFFFKTSQNRFNNNAPDGISKNIVNKK